MSISRYYYKEFIYISLIFLSVLSGCKEVSVIEAGKFIFGIQGELVQCLSDTVKLYQTDGLSIRQINASPLIKSGSYANFKFKGKVPQRGFYLIGTSTNNLSLIILGGEEEVKIKGNGTNWSQSTELTNSPQNDNYRKLLVQIAEKNKRLDSLVNRQAFYYGSGKATKKQKEELHLGFFEHKKEEVRYIDSLQKSDPYFATIARMSLLPVFDIMDNPKKYPNMLHSFANQYFDDIDLEDDNLEYMLPVWENAVTYTRTLVRAPQKMMGKDSVYLFLDKLLTKIPQKSRTYQLVLSGIMKGLQDEESGMYNKYALIYRKNYPQEEEVIAQITAKINEIDILEKKKQAFETGSEPPEIAMNDIRGVPQSLKALKGKIVLLHFWNSSAPACRSQIGTLVSLYKKYHFAGLEIMSVAIESEETTLLKTINDYKMNWIHVSDYQFWQSPVVQTYEIKAIPFLMLIDKEGKIAGKKVMGSELESKIKTLISNTSPER